MSKTREFEMTLVACIKVNGRQRVGELLDFLSRERIYPATGEYRVLGSSFTGCFDPVDGEKIAGYLSHDRPERRS